jgi:nucleoside-diphosphate-sugar epimerase
MKAADRVLVTGISGFIGQHCALAAGRAGYRVRGSLRNTERGPAVQRALTRHDGPEVELVQTDLTSDVHWDVAMDGCRFVLHVASPLPRQPPRHEDELIVPAREGTLRVLRAAAEAGVERVVLTSSIVAVLYGHPRDGSVVYDESTWTRVEPGLAPYPKSKTLAEQAAWEFVRGRSEPQLVVLNPGLVLGPILDSDYGTSGEIVRKLMRRDLPGCPDVGYALVDVRDVADAHVRALQVPAAAGERFILATEHHTLQDIASVLAEVFGPRGYRIPTRRIPNWMVRLAARFDPTTGMVLPDLGQRQDVSSAKARAVLGFEPRGLREMAVDMARSMVEHGVVPA